MKKIRPALSGYDSERKKGGPGWVVRRGAKTFLIGGRKKKREKRVPLAPRKGGERTHRG